MFFKKKEPAGDDVWLIAGLGNPGKKYEGTRHNAGFDALDFVAGEWGINVRRSKFDALTGKGKIDGVEVVLVKPQTFMNLSGVSIQKACDFYKIPPQQVLVLFDDVSLEPGVLRIRMDGSAGGHNGLKSIIASVGQEFPRVKIGVGGPPRPEYDLADWVLSRLTGDETKKVQARFKDVASAARLVVQGNEKEAMSLYNGVGRDN